MKSKSEPDIKIKKSKQGSYLVYVDGEMRGWMDFRHSTGWHMQIYGIRAKKNAEAMIRLAVELGVI